MTLTEDDDCPHEDCNGVLKAERQGEYTCHLHPPCTACVEAILVCNVCACSPSDPPE